MTSPPKVVLLSCGSFNPITVAHLRMFELARDYLHRMNICEVVEGIISPVHESYKKKDLIPSNHRCNMVRQALSSSDWIRLNTWECEQDGWLETINVMNHHQNRYTHSSSQANTSRIPTKRQKLDKLNANRDEPDKSLNIDTQGPIHVKLLVGADLLESFAVPDLWANEDIEAIVNRFGLVVISRSDTNPKRFIYESDVLAKFERNIHLVTEWIPTEISATKIRRALRREESVKYFVPDSVIEYIKSNRLYGTEST